MSVHEKNERRDSCSMFYVFLSYFAIHLLSSHDLREYERAALEYLLHGRKSEYHDATTQVEIFASDFL